jgi:DHA2 family multidrug resistance protein
MAVMLGPAIGPTLGGYIVDNFDWPWIFYINIPVGIVGLSMVYAFVHEDEEIREANKAIYEQQKKHMDWWGIALLVVGLCALQYFLEEGASKDWFDDRGITICFVFAVVGVVGFVYRELTAKAPIVDLRLFKDSVFASGTLIGALMFAMLMANMFLLPIFMQELLGFDATQSGWALMPRVLVMMVATPFVGRIYNAVSPRIIIGAGVIFFTIGAVAMSHFTLQTSSADIIASIAIQGVGFACLFVPLTTTALASIPRHRMTEATGLNSLLRQIGGSIGLAVFATLLGKYQIEASNGLAAHVPITSTVVQQRLQMMTAMFQSKGIDAVRAKQMAITALQGTLGRQAMVLSFEKVFLLAGILFLFVLPMLIFLRVKRDEGGEKKKTEHAEVHLDV